MTRQTWNFVSILSLALLAAALLAPSTVAQSGRGPGLGDCPYLDGQGPQGQGPQGQGPQGQGPQGQGPQAQGPRGQGPQGHRHHGQGGGCGDCGLLLPYIESLPLGNLDGQESAGILHNREEEKLGRDVYRTLAEKWNVRVFYNISAAEQRHMDLVKVLVDRYGLEDPVRSDEPGAFTSSEFTGLYEQLVSEGDMSLVAALRVGATIEDRDLYDLEIALSTADNADLRVVYQNLMKASRNHMRAFVSLLEEQGESYEAQFLDPQQMAEIVASPHERRVVYNENGEVLGTCGGGRRG